MTPNGNLYLPDYRKNMVSVISGQNNTVIGSPTYVGLFRKGLEFDPANGDLYVTNENSNSVSNIRSECVLCCWSQSEQ